MEYLGQFRGKEQKKAEQDRYEAILKKNGGWRKGYRIKIVHKMYDVYWVYLVHP